jgi:hypothetical protein
VCWCVSVLVLVCWCVGVLVCWCVSVLAELRTVCVGQDVTACVSGGALPWEYDREREREMRCDSVWHSAGHDVCLSVAVYTFTSGTANCT